MPGQDFLDLLNSEESTPATPGDDFNELMNSDSTGIDTSKIKIQSNDYEEKLTEPQLDQIEQQNSPGIVDGTIQAAQGGYKELKGIYHTLSKTEEYLHPVLKSYMKAVRDPSAQNMAIHQDNVHKIVGDVNRALPDLVKASPEIATALIQDIGKSFGLENNQQTGEFRADIDVALNKFREAPLSTIADWTVLGAVFKKLKVVGETISLSNKMKSELYIDMGKHMAREASIKNGINEETIRKGMQSDKDYLRNLLGEMDSGTQKGFQLIEFDKNTKSIQPNIKDKLFDNRKAFLSIPKESLDNPNFVIEMGDRIKTGINDLMKVEQSRLKISLAPVAENKIDQNLLFERISKSLKDNNLFSLSTVMEPNSYRISIKNYGESRAYEKGSLYSSPYYHEASIRAGREAVSGQSTEESFGYKLRKSSFLKDSIKKEYKGTIVENFLNNIDNRTTVGQLNDMAIGMREKINWGDSKKADKALSLVSDEMKRYIKELKGAEYYSEESSKVHDRLSLFAEQQKKILKPGGGEAFAKTFFKSDEELQGFKDVLKNSNTVAAQQLRANIDTLDALHTYNRMFSQNTKLVPDFYMGYPLTTGLRAVNTVVQPVAKSLVRAQAEYPEAINAAKNAVPSLVGVRNTARANRASESLDTSQY